MIRKLDVLSNQATKEFIKRSKGNIKMWKEIRKNFNEYLMGELIVEERRR